MLSTVKEGKEYYFGCGEHGAIVRRQNGKLQYLELQGANGDNGFKELNYNVLKKRFKAKKPSTQVYKIKIAKHTY